MKSAMWRDLPFAPKEFVLVNPVVLDGLRMTRNHGLGVHKAVFRVPPTKNRATFTAFDHMTVSDIMSGHYLSGFRVKVLEGRLPKGRLRVHVDTVPVVDEPVAFFTKEVLPSKMPWQRSKSLFGAIPIEKGAARPREFIGFALPNASVIKGFLDLESAPRGALLEIQVLGGHYVGDKACFPLVPEEIPLP